LTIVIRRGGQGLDRRVAVVAMAVGCRACGHIGRSGWFSHLLLQERLHCEALVPQRRHGGERVEGTVAHGVVQGVEALIDLAMTVTVKRKQVSFRASV